MDDGPPLTRDNSHLSCPRFPVPKTVAALMVNVEGVMGVLDRRDPMTTPREFSDQLFHERGFACVLETGYADHPVHVC